MQGLEPNIYQIFHQTNITYLQTSAIYLKNYAHTHAHTVNRTFVKYLRTSVQDNTEAMRPIDANVFKINMTADLESNYT
jgi:hypothetical protein